MPENPNIEKIGNRNHDGLFKEMLCCFFKEYIEFTQPHVLDMLDFTHVIPRDTHVSGLAPIKKKGVDFYVDAAFEVKKKNGELVIFHIEAQSYREAEFPKRMYEYNALCRIKYGFDVTSQAICFNADQRSIPNEIIYTDFTTGEVSNKSNYVKIDLNSYDLEIHRNSNNLFAIAILGLMEGYDSLSPSEKAELKLQSYIKLYENRLDKRKHSLIASFLEIYMVLDKEEYNSFTSRLEEQAQRINGLEEWVMQMAKNNEWARIIKNEERKQAKEEAQREAQKDSIKLFIKLVKSSNFLPESELEAKLTDEYIAQNSKVDITIVRQAKEELESE
ncbi:hypothetical protein [Bacillus cereus]|uniref:hypothetical protein n=1 Tax=Bacillus cereus TaxID=1396 RepID=UPI00124DA49F|nr:hypothetical protein [Bacillus cereus]KAB2477767.1 hypothetical protein F8159_17505 [Bacillus cereus]